MTSLTERVVGATPEGEAVEVVAHPAHLLYQRVSLGVERVPTNTNRN